MKRFGRKGYESVVSAYRMSLYVPMDDASVKKTDDGLVNVGGTKLGHYPVYTFMNRREVRQLLIAEKCNAIEEIARKEKADILKVDEKTLKMLCDALVKNYPVILTLITEHNEKINATNIILYLIKGWLNKNATISYLYSPTAPYIVLPK